MESDSANRPVKTRRPTLNDVALAAGVHASTVSRVLRRLPNYDGTDAKSERIRAIAKSMGYSRNLWAASLRSQRTRTLGVILPELTDVVMAALYEAIEMASRRISYHTFVAVSHSDPDGSMRIVELMLERHVDGLLIADVTTDVSRLEALQERGIPFVLVMRGATQFPSVTVNDHSGGGLAASHLLDQGHTSFGVVAGPSNVPTARERVRGFVETVRARNVDLAESRLVTSSFGAEGGIMATEKLMRSDRQPTAIFAVNDYAAIGAMHVLKNRGRAPGSDVALVGYNDIPLSAIMPVGISSIHVPLEQVGEEAVKTIASVIEGESVTSTVLDPELRVRESSVFNPQRNKN